MRELDKSLSNKFPRKCLVTILTVIGHSPKELASQPASGLGVLIVCLFFCCVVVDFVNLSICQYAVTLVSNECKFAGLRLLFDELPPATLTQINARFELGENATMDALLSVVNATGLRASFESLSEDLLLQLSGALQLPSSDSSARVLADEIVLRGTMHVLAQADAETLCAVCGAFGCRLPASIGREQLVVRLMCLMFDLLPEIGERKNEAAADVRSQN